MLALYLVGGAIILAFIAALAIGSDLRARYGAVDEPQLPAWILPDDSIGNDDPEDAA